MKPRPESQVHSIHSIHHYIKKKKCNFVISFYSQKWNRFGNTLLKCFVLSSNSLNCLPKRHITSRAMSTSAASWIADRLCALSLSYSRACLTADAISRSSSACSFRLRSEEMSRAALRSPIASRAKTESAAVIRVFLLLIFALEFEERKERKRSTKANRFELLHKG